MSFLTDFMKARTHTLRDASAGNFFSLGVGDSHDQCVICLGQHHAQSTLCLPGECPHCAIMYTEAVDNDLPCAQPTANKDATGQPMYSPPAPWQGRTTLPSKPCWSRANLAEKANACIGASARNPEPRHTVSVLPG